MKSLTLFNQPIRVGEDGMICLTDMWKASGKSDAESPYHYLRNKQTKEFLAELEKNHESVVFTARGVHGGTYGGKFVAYDYAAWIRPEFEIRVYETFREAVLNGITNMSRLNRLDLLIANETKEVSACARAMNKWGVGGRKKLLNCARERIVSQMDPDMVTLMEAKAG
ncbi:KilA-N domain-containing protein [Enterobacter cloacae complex sp. EB5]|nr:KilA-N domain-containing protein [Enterobacter cloacae complex sp. EB5]WMY43867.1 KilA-N domain-containing protein [Enterobacter cloacae complex sp. EB5]